VPKKKKIVYPVVFMVAITMFFTLILAGVNELSINTIERQEKLKIQSKVLNSLGLEYEDKDHEIIKIYNEIIEENEINDWKYHKAIIGESVEGYAFIVNGPGLWGMIEGIVALDSDFSNILGVEFVSHSETPGLGGRIDEKWFIDQFGNIPITDEEGKSHLIYRPSTGGNVDAISGATKTSQAVVDMFNESIDEILKMKEDII